MLKAEPGHGLGKRQGTKQRAWRGAGRDIAAACEGTPGEVRRFLTDIEAQRYGGDGELDTDRVANTARNLFDRIQK